MARIVVTGAAGFIGRQLCKALAADGHGVLGLVRRLDAAILSPTSDVRLAELVLDPHRLAQLLIGVDLLVHAAASSPGPGRRIDDFIRDNTGTTAALLDACRLAGVPNVVQLSAISVYGQAAAPILDETVACVDPDAYGLSKRLAELLCEEAVDRRDITGCLILRLPGVIGPGMRRPWLGELARKMRDHQEVTIYNPEAMFNNALHIDTLCRFVGLLAGRRLAGIDCVNLATSQPMTVASVAQTLLRSLGSTSPLRIVPAVTRSFTISTRRAEEFHGFAPQTLAELLDRLGNEIGRAEPPTADHRRNVEQSHA